MDIFARQKRFIDEMESSIFAEMQNVVNSYDEILKDYVVTKQLYNKGIDGDGERLPGYKRTTIRYKIRKGQPVDRTTLHDEELFVASITIQGRPDEFEISSNVSYDKYIIKKYGRNVLKVSTENMKEFMEVYFLPNLKEKINGRFAK